MSTKIFEGRKIVGFNDFNELFNRIKKMRLQCRELAEQMFIRTLASHVSYILDYQKRYGQQPDWKTQYECNFSYDRNILQHLMCAFEFKRQHIRETNKRNPNFDFDLYITFFPGENGILYIPSAEQSELIAKANKVLQSKPYPYWNNIDPPEKLTHEEWKKRGEEWDDAFDNDVYPSGLMFELFGYTSYMLNIEFVKDDDYNNVTNHLPDEQKRKSKLARNELIREHMYDYGKNARPSDAMEVVRYLHETDEGQKEVNNRIESIELETITVEKLKSTTI